ncbi:MAG: O-acetyl-ADP-ribose deacetylase [Alphaproteobacteria bacterium]|nr:O-acetyl-ADP-ribose deacetylase [Alphaproteobacteria bacterium]
MTGQVFIIQGDITHQAVDAIVNAANETLLGGGGVDGAIHRAAGPELLEACRALRGCKTGDAKATEGFCLPANWVIHTVGPIWTGGSCREDALLVSAYRRSLEVAVALGAKTVAFPSVSTGAYRFPLPRAAALALKTIGAFVRCDDALHEVRMVCFDPATFDVYRKEAASQGLLSPG